MHAMRRQEVLRCFIVISRGVIKAMCIGLATRESIALDHLCTMTFVQSRYAWKSEAFDA